MPKKLLYLIIACCFSSLNVVAQPGAQARQDLLHYLQPFKNNIKLIDNNLSEPCKRKFEKNFKKIDTTALSTKTTEQLLKTAKNLVKSYKSPDNICSNKATNKVDTLTNILIGKLKIVINQIDQSSKIRFSHLTIEVFDDSDNKPIHPVLVVKRAGSVDNIIATVKKAGDTAKFVYDSLVPNEDYLVTARDSSYADYSENLKITGDTIKVIKLKRLSSAEQKNGIISEPKTASSDTAKAIKTLIQKSTFLFIFIGALFLLVLIGALLYTIRLMKRNIRYRNENKLTGETISELQEDIKTKDAIIERLSNDLSLAQSPLTQQKNEPVEAVEEEPNTAVGTTTTTRQFICEVMMTAGPRKKFMSEPDADKDLGEDVCGFVSGASDVRLWVLDGTSDLHCLKNPSDNREYFSSRLLAQFLAEKLRSNFTEKNERRLDKVVLKCINEVKEEFLQQINNLPEDEKFFLKKNIENKNFPECATTILIAQLSLSGDFNAYRSGDSKVLLFSQQPGDEFEMVKTTLSDKNEQSNDRLFFRLTMQENGKLDIYFNQPNHEIINEKNISTAISFSDGVGIDTELLLKEEYKKNPQLIRKEIMYQLQSTGDDKSICFIEIKETK